MADKLKDVKQIEMPSGSVDYSHAGWANKSYDLERPHSGMARMTDAESIELLVASENYLHPSILNRPLIQLVDNTLINKIVSSIFLDVIAQDGFLGHEDFGYDINGQGGPQQISLNRGRYVLNGKYVDLLHKVHNGKITTITEKYVVPIESGLPDGSYALYLNTEGESLVVNLSDQLPNDPLIKVGEFSITNGNITGFTDKRNIITIGSAAMDAIKNAINSLYWQNGVSGMVDELPQNPSVGERYILNSDAKIYMWDGEQWTSSSPEKGYAVYDKNTDTYRRYNGTNWAPFLIDGTGMSLYGLREVFTIGSDGQTEIELQNYTNENEYAKVVYKNGILMTPKDGDNDNDYEIVVENNVGVVRFFAPLEEGDIINVIYYQPASTTSLQMKADKYGVSDIEIAESGKGLILRSQNGSRWRIRVGNDGNLMTELLS